MRFYSTGSSNQVDYYATLGVSPTATAEEIKTAYKKLALEFHPDRNHTPGAEDRFKEIAAAYHVVGNRQRRQAYDAERQQGFHSPPGAGGGFSEAPTGSSGYTYRRMSKQEADDLFQEIFGSFHGVDDLFAQLEEEMRRSAKQQPKGGAHWFSPGGTASSRSSSTRIYFDSQGHRVEEQTYSAPGGTYYRVSSHPSGSEGAQTFENMSSSAYSVGGQRVHPFFSRSAHHRSGLGEGEEASAGEESRSGHYWNAHRESTGQDPREFFFGKNMDRPPASLSTVAVLRMVAWLIIVTSLIWIFLSTLFSHPALLFGVLLLMIVGRRR